MDRKQVIFLNRRFKLWYVPGWKTLLKKLKAMGGKMLVPQPEPIWQVNRMIEEGQQFPTAGIVLRRKEGSACHKNSSLIWLKRPDLQLVTGYALSGDLWRQHTWLWDPKAKHIIETTVIFTKYFGFILTDKPNDPAREFEAFRFVMSCAPDQFSSPEKLKPELLVRLYASFEYSKANIRKVKATEKPRYT